jgi:hypothetical protein
VNDDTLKEEITYVATFFDLRASAARAAIYIQAGVLDDEAKEIFVALHSRINAFKTFVAGLGDIAKTMFAKSPTRLSNPFEGMIVVGEASESVLGQCSNVLNEASSSWVRLIASETEGINEWTGKVKWTDQIGSLYDVSNVPLISALVKNPHYPQLSARATYISKIVRVARDLQKAIPDFFFEPDTFTAALEASKHAVDTVVVTNVLFKMRTVVKKTPTQKGKVAEVEKLETLAPWALLQNAGRLLEQSWFAYELWTTFGLSAIIGLCVLIRPELSSFGIPPETVSFIPVFFFRFCNWHKSLLLYVEVRLACGQLVLRRSFQVLENKVDVGADVVKAMTDVLGRDLRDATAGPAPPSCRRSAFVFVSRA